MVNIIRRFQKPLMIGITAFTIISFIWLFNRNSMNDRYRSSNAATMYGHGVSIYQLQRSGSLFRVSATLQMGDLLQGLLGREIFIGVLMRRVSEEQAAQEFAFNDLILRHEAEHLGIQPTTGEVDDAVKALPAFQTGGSFDSSKMNQFVALGLGPYGLTGDALEEAVRDSLRLQKLKELVGSAATPTPSEVRTAYEDRFRKTDVSVVRLKLDDFKSGVALTDDDLKKAYEERKETLKTPEKRKVKYVAYLLDAKKPPVGTERMETLEKLAEQAGDFSTKMTENAKFDELAAKLGVPVQETPEFEESAPPEGLDAAAAQAAFKLTKTEPNSDAIGSQKRDGYYVVQLMEITPSRPLTFEEAKPQLTPQLIQEHAQEAMNLKAAEIRQKIEAEMKTGKSFADAAQAAGVKAEAFPSFSQADRKTSEPDGEEIASASGELAEGEVSQFVPTANGGLVLRLDKREPIDVADFEKQKPALTKELTNSQSAAIFDEWLKARRKEANIQAVLG